MIIPKKSSEKSIFFIFFIVGMGTWDNAYYPTSVTIWVFIGQVSNGVILLTLLICLGFQITSAFLYDLNAYGV